MNVQRIILLVLLPLWASACDWPFGPETPPLLVEQGGQSFVLVNATSSDTLTWTALTAREQPLVSLAPCSEWPRLAPRTRRLVPHRDVMGYRGPGTDRAVVLWCRWREGQTVDEGSTTVPL